jgi:hypothetical protein
MRANNSHHLAAAARERAERTRAKALEGNRPRPMSLACRIRSSTRAWARWRASRNCKAPVVVLVANAW